MFKRVIDRIDKESDTNGVFFSIRFAFFLSIFFVCLNFILFGYVSSLHFSYYKDPEKIVFVSRQILEHRDEISKRKEKVEHSDLVSSAVDEWDSSRHLSDTRH